MGNIFEDIMAANEFIDAVAEKIAKDWQPEDAVVTNLYRWIQGGFANSLTEAVREKVEK